MERVYWTEPDRCPVDSALEPLILDAFERGYHPYRDGDFLGAFGVSNGATRQVDFIHRGRGRRGWRGPLLEVLLVDANVCYRLGPCFGLKESACVVVNGCEAAIQVCRSWLDGDAVESVIATTEFMNRRDLSVLEHEGRD